jgi:hypothetical protein
MRITGGLMKAIINGKKYNTETSTRIAIKNRVRHTEDDWGKTYDYDETWDLYKTQKGNYFEVFTKRHIGSGNTYIYNQELSAAEALALFYKYKQTVSEEEAFPDIEEQ